MHNSFSYDYNNKLTWSSAGWSLSYDADGNMLSDGISTYGYDSANRLISAGSHTYTYNAENTRIRNLCSDSDTTYTYNTNCRLSQLLTKIENGITTKYVYGLGLIGEENCEQFKTYHFDYRGSTVAITDECGNITDTFEYDTYGSLLSRTGNSVVIFGYNGRDGVVTDNNGLIYMRARYYSPSLRRFVNADILHGDISDPATLNRYAYVNGNPVSFVDPMGMERERGSTGTVIKLASYTKTNYNWLDSSLLFDHPCDLWESGKQGPLCPITDPLLAAAGYCVSCGSINCCGEDEFKLNSINVKRLQEVVERVKAKDYLEGYKGLFVLKLYLIALKNETETNIPAAITTSQAIIESSYGSRVPIDEVTKINSYNIFGIKGKGPAGSVMTTTHEKDRTEEIIAEFRAYNSYDESIDDHSKLLTGKRYGHLVGSSVEDWAYGLQESGYCQDSDYAEQILAVIDSWNLS